MASRLDLHDLFKEICNNVYYRPPKSSKMSYPAILYDRIKIVNTFANNKVYKQDNLYKVTVIDPDPDSSIVELVSKMPSCRFGQSYIADNLNHTTFIIQF